MEQESPPQDSSMMDFARDDIEILEPQTKAENIRATPSARRLAKYNTISLKKVTGTGPMGRIEKKDVEDIMELHCKKGQIVERCKIQLE